MNDKNDKNDKSDPMNDKNDKNDKTRTMLEFATMRAQALEASRSDLEMLEVAGFRVWATFERRVDELGREYMHASGWRVTSGNRPAGYDAADFYALAVACASNLARHAMRKRPLCASAGRACRSGGPARVARARVPKRLRQDHVGEYEGQERMISKTHALHNGDCLDVLATLPAESVDVAIEDPPAGIAFMGRAWDNLARYEPRTERGKSVHAGLLSLGFAKWEAGFVAFMTEVHVAKLRVLKPGAMVASWALPKTSHLSAMALRLAGYEVIDYVTHLFGQGMAKAGDLGKKIDKAAGAEREVVGTKVYAGGHVQRSAESIGYGGCDPASDTREATAPATPEAEQWADWSTQLAPGCEFWILARKPTKLTMVQQVLTHGCGAMNIGACRVPRGDGVLAWSKPRDMGYGRDSDIEGSEATYHSGSWPKNVVLTEGGEDCPVAEIDRQSGVQRDGVAVKRNLPDEGGKPGITAISPGTQRGADQGFGGQGGASRYFNRFRIAYYAKASDRSVPGSDDPKANRHETHKHPELMRWLVRLLARPGNVVLDCFMGSGTTGVACAAEGVSFIGIEREPKHFAVAQARIEFAYAAENPEHYSPKRAKTKRG